VDASFDVIVVGGGNAALCAALAARERARRVLVLERAPRDARGGNSWFTAGLVRFPYRGLDDLTPLVPELAGERDAIDVGSYDEAEFESDLERMSEGRADPVLVRVLVEQARPTLGWLASRGVRYQLARAQGRQAFQAGGRLRFVGGACVEFAGGGAAHVDRLFALAERAGIEVRYGARALALRADREGRVRALRVLQGGAPRELETRAVVLACGGFEADPELRAKHLGAAWRDVRVRGTAFNTGDGLRMALELGAAPHGDFASCHAVAWDAGASPVGDRRVGNGWNKHSYPFGITVNREGRRFLDEGADFRNYTYAKYGAAILGQPGGLAFQIFDAKVRPLLREEYFLTEATRAEAPTLGELADALGVAREPFLDTVRRFNRAAGPSPFDPTRRDGKGTRGLEPPKSNWALPLDRPPFLGAPVACGITFTFGGIRVDPGARVLRADGRPIPGLFAAGELVGGLFHGNYPGGAGLASGSVFGRLAGTGAASSTLAEGAGRREPWVDSTDGS
jgi:tricarballylate dehydrogenase